MEYKENLEILYRVRNKGKRKQFFSETKIWNCHFHAHFCRANARKCTTTMFPVLIILQQLQFSSFKSIAFNFCRARFFPEISPIPQNQMLKFLFGKNCFLGVNKFFGLQRNLELPNAWNKNLFRAHKNKAKRKQFCSKQKTGIVIFRFR